MRTLQLRGVRLLLTGVASLLVLLSLTPVGASSANISHSYHASGTIRDGSMVSLDPRRSDYVQLADISNGPRLVGVALNSGESLLAVDETSGGVQVANSGTVKTLVSTLGGSIKVGDEIGVSPFSGIGMKAIPGANVIGLAQTAFNKESEGAVSQAVTDKDGKSSQVTVGYVRLSIAITINSTASKLGVLQNLAKQLTGKTVSTARVIISLMVVVVAMLILVTLTYASIYGSIISVGRNPLAKYTIFRSLTAVMAMLLLTVCVATASVYFLLH